MDEAQQLAPVVFFLWRALVAVGVGAYAQSRDFRFWPYFFFGAAGGLFLPLITLSIARWRARAQAASQTMNL